MKYYFNWNELKRDAGSNYAGILILLNCLLIGYNKKMANSGKHLMLKMKLNNIPLIIFRKKLLFVQKQGIYSRYKCNDPQSYFINKDFITSGLSVANRAEYLYILAQRPISVTDTFIPKNYVSKRLWKNPFIEIDDTKIHFITERSQIAKEKEIW